MNRPEDFLEILVHEFSQEDLKGITGLSVGYELGNWRNQAFSDHLMEWLPEFCLSFKERESLSSSNAVALLRKAAKKVYSSKKFESRGEFGELMLHIVLRQVFGSLPAVNKLVYKSSANETVKGFDSVHIVYNESSLELWLGEVKFYKEISLAISDVITELNEHTNIDYMRDEFLIISDKIEDSWPHSDRLKNLISPNTSMDKIFDAICVPVLLTYESRVVKFHNSCCDEYLNNFKGEIIKYSSRFFSKQIPENLKIHLFLIPLHDKEELVKNLDKKLRNWQQL